MKLIIPGKKDVLLALLSQKIKEVLNRPEIADERSFFCPEADIPYVADLISSTFRIKNLDVDGWGYLFISTVGDDFLNIENPVLSQEIADRIVLSLILRGKFPRDFGFCYGTHIGRTLYMRASESHPDKSIRPVLASMGENFPVWVEALPRVRKEISLLV